jgi:calcineurin-like phosphoesterase family protein
MTDWFTADQHFGHANIIKYCNRPFKNVGKMDAELVRRWNEVVKPEDKVYVLGDFTLGDNAERYGNCLSGEKFFMNGSHDHRWFGTPAEWNYLPPLYSLEYPRKGEYPLVIVLCHYAMMTWDRSHHGSYHLYGHSHGRLEDPLPRSMDVGVDCWDFYPVPLETIKAMFVKDE